MTKEEKKLAELILNDSSLASPSVEELNRELEEEISGTEPDMDLVNELILFIQEYEGKAVSKPDRHKLISDILKTEKIIEEQNIKVISQVSKKHFLRMASACAAVIAVLGITIILSENDEPYNISVIDHEVSYDTDPVCSSTFLTEKTNIAVMSSSERYTAYTEKTDSINTNIKTSESDKITFSSQPESQNVPNNTVHSDIYYMTDNVNLETTKDRSVVFSDTVPVINQAESEPVTTFAEQQLQVPDHLQPESFIRIISDENNLRVSIETKDITAVDMLSVTDDQKNSLIDYLNSEIFFGGVSSRKYTTENSTDWHISVSYDNISFTVNENNDIVFSDGEIYYSFNIPGSYSTTLDIFNEILGYPFPAYYMNSRYFSRNITCNGITLTQEQSERFEKIIKDSSYYVLTPEQYEERNSGYMKNYAPDREYIFNIKFDENNSYVYEIQYANSLKYIDIQNNHTYQGIEPEVFSKITELGRQICDK